MPRVLRKFNKGSIYHIVNRGVDKRPIFLNNQDYSRFILGLEFFNTIDAINLWDMVSKTSKTGSDPTGLIYKRLEARRRKDSKPIVELMVFVCMPNHFHLIVREIIEGGTALFMQKMGGYSTYFNKQYERVGSLFQSRYKSVEVKDENQLTNVFVYVHTNPIVLWEEGWKDFEVKNFKEAIGRLGTYKWSSYNNYIGDFYPSTVIKKEFFTKFFGGPDKCRQVIEDWVSYKSLYAKPGPEVIE